MTATLQRLFNVRRDEVLPVLFAVLFFFCVLTAIMLLRPARDALGMQRGIEAVRWLFIGTAVVTLAVNPVFGLVVSRMSRLGFITATYLFFSASLFGFYLLMVLAPEAISVTTGQIFYVWFSVFNLFATMVFWALMVDRFTLDQGKRFFGMVAVGGTCGALFGPWLASVLVETIGTPALLLLTIGFLLLALVMAWAVAWVHPDRVRLPDGVHEAVGTVPEDRVLIGGSAWEGFRAVFRSRYLLAIAAFVVILAIMATFIYFTRLQMVAAIEDGVDQRTAIFARIDMITQLATLVMQALIAGHLMRRLGVHITLAILPVTAILGFLGLAIVGTLAALIALEATFRAVQRAIMRPARETLYTVVGREDKYKSKAFIDTFIYRGGDVVGAQVEGGLGRLGLALGGIAAVAIPLALVWAALAVWLGRAQQRIAASGVVDGAGRHPSETRERSTV